MTKIVICNLWVTDENEKFQLVELPLYLKNTFISHFGLMEPPTLVEYEAWLEETIAYSQIEKLNLTVPSTGEKVTLTK
jgi:hypothetical protein